MNLLRFDVLGKTQDHFDNRFKIQKYVFLAKEFGLDMGYDFTRYIHGPYSSELANDYYDLGKYGAGDTVDLPSEFDLEEFNEFVRGKDTTWLESAATLLSLTEYFGDRQALIEKVSNMKEHISKTDIESALADLEKKELISSH
jgi:uncharacterized protein YwgA